jgi:hypothetical protein
MTKDGIRFLHVRTEDCGAVTLAYAKGPPQKELWIVAAAFCSPQDNFCRALGRQIAAGRLSDALAILEAAGAPIHLPFTSVGWYGPAPHSTPKTLLAVLDSVSGQPYRDGRERGPLWYPLFLHRVAEGRAIRRRAMKEG